MKGINAVYDDSLPFVCGAVTNYTRDSSLPVCTIYPLTHFSSVLGNMAMDGIESKCLAQAGSIHLPPSELPWEPVLDEGWVAQALGRCFKVSVNLGN